MTAETKPANAGIRWSACAALAVLAAALIWRLVCQVGYIGWAIRYPYGLDYGEGIVWQQMRLLFTPRAYGPIDGFPAIVFHYPPVYHALTALVSALGMIDPLAAGRAVSAAGLALAALAAGSSVGYVIGPNRPLFDRLVGAGAAALILCSTSSVVFWVPLMRVDLLALGLSFLGLWLAMLALERPAFIYGAALAFVLALFTKQTMIAAPGAAFAVLLLARPRTAFAGISTALLLGLTMLAFLEWWTDGGFVRHIFLYNLNRFDPAGLWLVWYTVLYNSLLLALALLAMALSAWPLVRKLAGAASVSELRTLLTAVGRGRLLMLVGHLGITILLVPLIAKSGASQNYLIEWVSSAAMFAGIGVAELARLARGERGATRMPLLLIAATVALALQIGTSAKTRGEMLPPPPPPNELARLVAMIHAADRPVISDDMVAIIRGGKDVVWEPAIFTELDGSSYFSARPFVEKIRRRDFAFLITFGQRGNEPFDARYTPDMAEAMDVAYPRLRDLAGLTLHLPPATERREK